MFWMSWAYECAVDLLVKMECLEADLEPCQQHSFAKNLNILKRSNSMPLWVCCTGSTGWVWLVCMLVHILYLIIACWSWALIIRSFAYCLTRKMHRKTSEIQTINHHHPGSRGCHHQTTAILSPHQEYTPPQHTTTISLPEAVAAAQQ